VYLGEYKVHFWNGAALQEAGQAPFRPPRCLSLHDVDRDESSIAMGVACHRFNFITPPVSQPFHVFNLQPIANNGS
jgi:hypothetical protein